MEFRTLGSTGTMVSTLCLGTMTFGAESTKRRRSRSWTGSSSAAASSSTPPTCTRLGVPRRSSGGGCAARPGVRERIVVATKGRFAMGDGPNDAGLSRTHLTRALDASLRRLGVDHVDLYQAHAWDPLTPIEETLGFFDDAVRAGKIRYAGVSNFIGWQLQKAALLGRARPPRSSPCSRSTTCSSATSSSRSSTCAATRASASCPGRRSPAAG